MSASLKPLSLDEFLAWEREQPARYEFDGMQPVAMTGGTIAADRTHAACCPPCKAACARPAKRSARAFGENVNVLPAGRARYPDVKVACGDFDPSSDHVAPLVVFEILSPATELTDRRVKPAEYASIPSVHAYVMLAQDRPHATFLRRAANWRAETIEGAGAVLNLPEIDVAIPLAGLFPTPG